MCSTQLNAFNTRRQRRSTRFNTSRHGIQRPKTSSPALSGLISHLCHLICRVCANRCGAKRPKLCGDESRHHQQWRAGEAQTLRRRSGFSQPALNHSWISSVNNASDAGHGRKLPPCFSVKKAAPSPRRAFINFIAVTFSAGCKRIGKKRHLCEGGHHPNRNRTVTARKPILAATPPPREVRRPNPEDMKLNDPTNI